MTVYPFAEVEKKWRKRWEDRNLHRTDMDDVSKKLYCLVMFIYPSGDRLHIGHWYNYGPTDIWARFKRMQGWNVFEPIGYDAFGLPAENYAIKKNVHPADSTAANIRAIRKQLKAIGAMYDWSKEINTSEPKYYKWTQWFFLLLYKNGLAYKKKAPVNWCPSCRTVLANEQVVEGRCERCESEVTRRDLEQWFFKITDYADKLLEGLDRIQWPEKTVTMQRNWIGRSEGAWVRFPVDGRCESIEVFTTRPDTLWGVTYMVLAPEHPLVKILAAGKQKSLVDAYVEKARKETDIDRTSLDKEKTGVFTGAYAVNPVNGEKVPIWIADYVLASYGTGAVMAVPAHDQRDFAFARKFGLAIREVISPDGKSHDTLDAAFVDPGTMVRSGPFDNEASEAGIAKVIRYLEEKGWGGPRVNFKLRDWLISRQRYWGAPIPMVNCPSCGLLPVPEKDLPVLLPREAQFKGTGESPLLTNQEWIRTGCPSCGGEARREADTMDTFVCSSWYFLRYPDPDIDGAPFNADLVKKWLPVDQYVGGAEHAVMHLMYARFFTKVLHDLGMIGFDEPFLNLFHQGTITRYGVKMSKSKGNVVNPEPYLEQYGTDVFRLTMSFMGTYSEGGDWSDEGIQGIHRFVNRIWRLFTAWKDNPPSGDETERADGLGRAAHYAAKHATQDLGRFHFNTAVSRIMELVNTISLYFQDIPPDRQNRAVLENVWSMLIRLIAPFAPHFGEELWEMAGNRDSVFRASWPEWDESKLKTETVTLVVQINGKVRSRVEVEADSDDDRVREAVLDDPKVQAHTLGKTVERIVVIKNRLVNMVVR